MTSLLETLGLKRAADPAPGGGGSRPGSRALGRFRRNLPAMSGVAVLIVVVAIAAAAPYIYPGDPLDMVARPFLWPGQDARYPLGTDALGRDVAAGLAHGASVSLVVGLTAALVGLVLGIVVGALGGYYGGLVDRLLGRLVELFQTIPQFMLLIVIVALAGPSMAVVTLAIGIVTWPTVARLVRAEFRSLRQRDFVLAAQGAGFSDLRIMAVEILPNALPPIIVTSSVLVAAAILMEAALAFLGLGDQNVVSWGGMIGAGREVLRTAWYLTAIPGVAIVIVVLALNFVSDGINEAINPHAVERD